MYISNVIPLAKEVVPMKWQNVDSKTWEDKFSEKYDFIVTGENGLFILDIFTKRIKKNSQAYIESFEYKSTKEAKEDAEKYI